MSTRSVPFAIALALTTLGVSPDVLAANEVELAMAHSYHGATNKYIWDANEYIQFHIDVEDLGADKQVYVRWKSDLGAWQMLPASFKENRSGGREIWSALFSRWIHNQPPIDVTFDLVYTVGDKTFVDDNGGAHYFIADNAGSMRGDRPLFHPPRAGGGSANFVKGVVASDPTLTSLRVIYSQDGWQTYDKLFARVTVNYPILSRITNPGPDGTILYSFDISAPSLMPTEYYFVAERNGTTIIDDNEGAFYHSP